MVNADTSQAGSLIASAAYAVGRGAGRLRPPAAGRAPRVGAVAGGAVVAALWATVFGWANLKKHRKGGISKKKAAKRIAAESVGIGLATGAGIAAVNAVRAFALTTISPALVPFLVGTAATAGAKATWDRMVAKQSPDPGNAVVAETGAQSNAPSI